MENNECKKVVARKQAQERVDNIKKRMKDKHAFVLLEFDDPECNCPKCR